jgi:uncharacterized membrane protein
MVPNVVPKISTAVTSGDWMITVFQVLDGICALTMIIERVAR